MNVIDASYALEADLCKHLRVEDKWYNFSQRKNTCIGAIERIKAEITQYGI